MPSHTPAERAKNRRSRKAAIKKTINRKKGTRGRRKAAVNRTLRARQRAGSRPRRRKR